MASGKRKRQQQDDLWVPAVQLSRASGHPFYEELNRIFDAAGFDDELERLFAPFYAGNKGRPGLAAGVYVRMLLVGYFEGIDSERGIAWRCADSLALRRFLGLELRDDPPDHSTVSRTRRRIDLETHAEVFALVLRILNEHGKISGKTVGIDATTLEANAAMKSLVRRDDGRSYDEFLTDLAKASGIETPTRAEKSRLDRKRKGKGSNDDWTNPNDPDAEITKMKDGRTHLAHKLEQAVDLESTAIVAARIAPGAAGDTATVGETLGLAIQSVAELGAQVVETVTDKGYHSNDVLEDAAFVGLRTYIAEPDRGRRNWKGKAEAKRAVYANRRRIRGKRGRALQRRRAEVVERPFAHCLETGGMRRAHLRGRENIEKRYLVHASGYNLGLVMREVFGKGTPRGLQGMKRLVEAVVAVCRAGMRAGFGRLRIWLRFDRAVGIDRTLGIDALGAPFTTAC